MGELQVGKGCCAEKTRLENVVSIAYDVGCMMYDG